ncbi:MAG TPA: hypothetical protein VFO82_13725 [Steroidobacteraceae bacterium]|nr:hypothetical protein [Steroidobacteraceae bacterium]
MTKRHSASGLAWQALLGWCAAALLAACAPTMDEVNERVGREVRPTLPQLLGVDVLPASISELQCKGMNQQCTENVYRSQCAFALDPADFDKLFDRNVLLDDPHDEPGGYLGPYVEHFIGPDFEVDQVFGGTPATSGVVLYTNHERTRVLVHVVNELDFDCD